MGPQIHRPDGKTILGAVTTVAAVYVYFLIFAQFGFLKAVQAALGDGPRVIRPIMMVMGLGGLAGSVHAARVFREQHARRWLAAGLVIGGIAAVIVLNAERPAGFYYAALLTGLGTGLATVTLAGMLRRAVGDEHLGLIIGSGTGLAYAVCNLPAVFGASAATQAWLALLAVAAGLAGGCVLAPAVTVSAPTNGDYSWSGMASWVLVFSALVGLDSAAFYIIQHTPGLKETLCDGSVQLVLNAGVHLVAAVLAGWALGRGWLARTVLLGATSLLLACLLLSGRFAAAGPLYIAGVSAYSVALVFYPARSGRPRLAALVYTVAGWGGSALGIGLANGRTEVPVGLILAAALAIALGLLWGNIARRRAT